MSDTPVATAAPAPAAATPKVEPAPAGSLSLGGDDIGSFITGLSGGPAPTTTKSELTQSLAENISELPAEVPGVGTMPAPVEAAAPAPAATEVPAPDKTEAPVAEVPKEAAPAATVPGARLFAEKFKTPEELEKAYTESVKGATTFQDENKRLGGVVGDLEAKVKDFESTGLKQNQEIEMLKLQMELGPEIKDPTPEEMAAWDPARIARHELAKDRRERKAEKLETLKSAAKQEQQTRIEKRTNVIFQRIEEMERNTDRFPNFVNYKDAMNGLLNLSPGLKGGEHTPLILYLAAHGHASLQRDRQARDLESTSKKAALDKVSAALPAAGTAIATGATGPAAAPPAAAGKTKSADAYADFIEATTGSRPLLPMS